MGIAVIGAGISGMAAAWLLSRKYDVIVYERNAYTGGHSNTVDAPTGDGAAPVDTGFIVYNDATYPNLVRLFQHLGVPTEASNMSFAVSANNGRLEYAGSNLAALFAQRRNLLRPSHYLMLRDIVRFYREAPALLSSAEGGDTSLGDYLAAQGYGRSFVYNHLLPMGAAIWSATVAEMMGFPARSFVRFFHNHGLLNLKDRPRWRTVVGGSREYVRRLTAPYADRIRHDCPVAAVRRSGAGVYVRQEDGTEERYDHVVIATHADQARALLADASAEEARVLEAFVYQPNRAVLHRDPRLMPRRRKAWASWNYLTREGVDEKAAVSVTYWMNQLQNIDPADPLFVSLNPLDEPRDELKIAEYLYHHPVFDAAAVAMQAELPAIQGGRDTWFCGSYCGYGFHEDGLSSGLAVAEALGVKRPWSVEESSPAGRNATPARAAVAVPEAAE